MSSANSCADPGIFVRVGSRPGSQNTALTRFFGLFVLNLFYSQMVFLQRKLYFSKDPEGSNIFQGGGGATFSRGGPNANLYINPYNL